MSFLKEIEPLYQYVELALSGKGYPRKEIIEEIAAIDYKLRQKERARIYGNPKAEVYPTDTSCGACIKSMFTNVKRWVDSYNKDQETVEFKGVPDGKAKRINKEVREAMLKGANYISEKKGVPLGYKDLKWPTFKTFCKQQGLSVKGKKRAELEEELKAL